MGWMYHRGEAEERIFFKKGRMRGKVMAVWIECEMLHESSLIVHQLHESHMADKNDENHTDDSWAANPGLFLDAPKPGCFAIAIGVFRSVCLCVSLSSRRPGCSNINTHKGVSLFVS